MPLEFQVRPWLWVKIFLVSLLFLAANILFYWGLFSQTVTTPEIIAPFLEFNQNAPRVRSGITGQENLAYFKQILFVGDEIKTTENQFAEILMGKNRLRLGPETHLQILDLNFSPLPSYQSTTPAMVFRLNQGQIWVHALDPMVARLDSYEAQWVHSIGAIQREEAFNTFSVFSGLAQIFLKDSDQRILNQLSLPLLKQASFSDDQLTADFASLKPSKLKKELNVVSLPQEALSEPWVNFHLAEEELVDTRAIRSIYSHSNYRFHNVFHLMRRMVALNASERDELWLEKANYTFRYWLGGVANDSQGKRLEQVERDWLKIEAKMVDPSVFHQWSAESFFRLPWGELGSSQFALKEQLFKTLLISQGPVALRNLVDQMQMAFNSQQLGRIQYFTGKWLTHWKAQKGDLYLNEFMAQFEMVQQLGLTYPQSISAGWLGLLDQAAELLLQHLPEDEEFELALTESRLSQVAALIQAYRYDFAKDYLRTSYQNLPIASGQELSSSQEVFFELGKLLAQRIEYAELTFGGAALPIDNEEFTRFVLQSRQSDLLSNDLAAFLEAEDSSVEVSSSALPTMESLLESLQLEGLVLDETQIKLSEDNPLAFQLTQVLFKDLDGVERRFNAVYFPLNRSFNEMVVEGEAIPGVFKWTNLSTALSLPALMAAQQQTEENSASISELFGSSGVNQQQRLAEELARQLAFNQLTQNGFNMSGPRMIQVKNPTDLERVKILNASFSWADSQQISLDFEYNTSSQTLYKVQNVMTQEVYFEEIRLRELKVQLSDLLQEEQAKQETLNLLKRTLSQEPVSVNEESIQFLTPTLIQVTQVTLDDLNLVFNITFNSEKSEFSSLVHPLYADSQISVSDYIPLLVQAYVNDFLKRNGLPVGGNWNIRQPFNRLKVSNYTANGNTFAFTLNLTREVFENIQLKGSDTVVSEATVSQFRQMSGV